MAKFNEYPSKATPEDADTLMVYDAAAKSNKLSPFSGIWNWIVGKLTNAVISNLQTNNKTVLGAINELNSKALIKNSMDISANNSTLTIKFPELNDLDLCALFAFVMLENQCYVSVQINHATIYASKIVSFCGANIITGTETWNTEQKTFTVQMNSDYKSVYTSNCYVIK